MRRDRYARLRRQTEERKARRALAALQMPGPVDEPTPGVVAQLIEYLTRPRDPEKEEER